MMPFPAKLFRLRSSRNNRRGFEPRTARSDARQAFSRGHTKSGTAGRTPVNDKHAKQEKSLFPAYIIAEKSADVKRNRPKKRTIADSCVFSKPDRQTATAKHIR